MKTRKFTSLEQSFFEAIDNFNGEQFEEYPFHRHKDFLKLKEYFDTIKRIFNDYGITIDSRSCMGFSAIHVSMKMTPEYLKKHIDYIYQFCYDNFYTEIDWELFKTQIYPNKIPVFD